MTCQQRRHEKRKKNKAIVRESRQQVVQRMTDERGQKALAEYQLSSKNSAVLLFCHVFDDTSKLDEYIQGCRECADTLLDDDRPKWIVFIKKTTDTLLPAPKQELMKICTRLFRKVAPHKPCLFLEMTEYEFENGGVDRQINEFILRFNEVPEEGEFPDWLRNFIYKETPTDDSNQKSC